MKDLIFIGGAKGVDKSTVIARIKEIIDIQVVNTGDIYRRAIEKWANPEDEIVDYLINYHFGLVDTHYTGGYSKTSCEKERPSITIFKLESKTTLLSYVL